MSLFSFLFPSLSPLLSLVYLSSLKILCAAPVNPAIFISDYMSAVMVNKEDSPVSGSDETSMSLVWICTGTEQLTKVHLTCT